MEALLQKKLMYLQNDDGSQKSLCLISANSAKSTSTGGHGQVKHFTASSSLHVFLSKPSEQEAVCPTFINISESRNYIVAVVCFR